MSCLKKLLGDKILDGKETPIVKMWTMFFHDNTSFNTLSYLKNMEK